MKFAVLDQIRDGDFSYLREAGADIECIQVPFIGWGVLLSSWPSELDDIVAFLPFVNWN